MRISTPAYARPIEPNLSLLKGTQQVPYALFSVIPQPSEMLTPIFLNHSSVVAGIGAEPLAHSLACPKPNLVRIFLLTHHPTIGIRNNKSSFFCGMLANTPI